MRDHRHDDVVIQNVLVIRETAKAILVLYDTVELWLPKSQICSDSSCDFDIGSEGDLCLSKWIADEKLASEED